MSTRCATSTVTPGTKPLLVIDLDSGDDREDGGAAEQPEAQLVRPISEQGLNDAGGKLAHRQLDGDRHDREHERDQRDLELAIVVSTVCAPEGFR